jgi:hypothetical protein
VAPLAGSGELIPEDDRSYLDGTSQFSAFLREHGMPTAVTAIAREHVEAFVVHIRDTRSASTAETNRCIGCTRRRSRRVVTACDRHIVAHCIADSGERYLLTCDPDRGRAPVPRSVDAHPSSHCCSSPSDRWHPVAPDRRGRADV